MACMRLPSGGRGLPFVLRSKQPWVRVTRSVAKSFRERYLGYLAATPTRDKVFQFPATVKMAGTALQLIAHIRFGIGLSVRQDIVSKHHAVTYLFWRAFRTRRVEYYPGGLWRSIFTANPGIVILIFIFANISPRSHPLQSGHRSSYRCCASIQRHAAEPVLKRRF